MGSFCTAAAAAASIPVSAVVHVTLIMTHCMKGRQPTGQHGEQSPLSTSPIKPTGTKDHENAWPYTLDNDQAILSDPAVQQMMANPQLMQSAMSMFAQQVAMALSLQSPTLTMIQ